ncbi:hypothetical protein Tco_1415883 [Tanacetum coccineum]
MITYLKNMGGYKHSQLKSKSLEEIQAMYEGQKKKIDDFKLMDSNDAVKDSKKAAGEDTSKKGKVLKEPDSTKIKSMNKEDAGERVSDVSNNRKGGPRMKRMSKRKKTESNLEEEEDLKTSLKIVPDKEGLIDYENQERWNLKSWNFYENYRVHILILEDGTEIHMLAERKYPLTKETLEKMMSLKLVAKSASDGAYNLLRSIQKQIDESGSYDGKQTATGKETSNPFMLVSTANTSISTGSRVSTVSISLDLSRLATTLNRLERSIQIGINKWYQSLLRNSE